MLKCLNIFRNIFLVTLSIFISRFQRHKSRTNLNIVVPLEWKHASNLDKSRVHIQMFGKRKCKYLQILPNSLSACQTFAIDDLFFNFLHSQCLSVGYLPVEKKLGQKQSRTHSKQRTQEGTMFDMCLDVHNNLY